MRAWAALLLLLAFVIGPGPAAAETNYFGRPAESAPPAAELETEGAAQRKAPRQAQTHPSPAVSGWAAGLVALSARLQHRFHRWLTAEVEALGDGGSWFAALGLIVASALYGVFHAVGPGHGKAVVSAYFLIHGGRLTDGIAMAAGIAATQAVIAITAVSVLAIAVDASRGSLIDSVVWLEVASYGLILVIGATMLWAAAHGRDLCCDHAHGLNHDHHDHGHAHHHHGHSIAAGHPAFIAVAAGLRPCTGAIIVLLFTLAKGVYLAGILAVIAMAAGVAVTVSLIGMGVLGARGVLPRLVPAGVTPHTVERVLGVGGAITITAIALFLGLGALARTGALGGLPI